MASNPVLAHTAELSGKASVLKVIFQAKEGQLVSVESPMGEANTHFGPLRVHFGPLPVHFRSTSLGLAPHGEVDWTGSGPEVGPAGTSAIQCWARGSSIHLQSTYFGPLRP